ncbi:d DNA polymerase (B family) [Invertebrate iridescent virus 22]|uniref:DNA polymerase n=1 Tax=Invertebrate iridescent virus 22 TaxID=345198 RepID=S6DA35_9VIRU|nr:d DNA polymerase (B family) [Invertebrate iridescent virus 22]CCV01678.1 d DNA polymerase (B family) [Invertebrate iridescent virus 22]
MVCNTKEIEYEFYAYSWHLDEEIQDETFIRAYGFDDQQKNICVSINGFQPFVWVELPTHINWKLGENKERLYLYFNQMFPNVKCTLKFCKKLYGANLKKKETNTPLNYFHFLMCSSPSFKELKFNLPSKLKTPQRIMGLGNLKFHVHGQDACPRLQLTSKYDLPTAGWIKFKGIEVVCEEDKFTSCDREFLVDLRLCKTQGIKPKDLISRSVKTTIPKPLVLSFDLEVNSEDTITMPKASRPGDVVFQISCVFSRLGSSVYDKYLLSLGDPQKNIVGANILKYSTEQKLLMGFKDLVNEKNPNVVIGYNIFNFDIPYLMDRANHKSIYPLWAQQGFAKGKSGIQREIKWSSSAYKNQEFKFLDCEGRLYIDLLPVVQRDFKLNDYKLKTVSTHFIGETKDDLDPKSIFRCYREGIKTQMLIIVKVGKKHFKLVGVEDEDNLKQQNFFDEVTDVFWVENAFSSIEYIRQKIKHLEDKNGHFKIKYCDLKYMVVNEAKLNLLQTKHRNSNNYLKIDNLSQKYMSICGKYCIQDSMLVSKLMDKLNVWYSLSEMAVICNVPMITLFTKGQQIKVYSNLYKFCLENKIIPEKDGYTVSENERYVGAYVFVPKPGLYTNVVPFDFSALYPSLIIAYNIDYSSCAFDPNIPDELCHVMEWEDHISCKHDPKVIEKNRLTKLIDELTSKKKSDKALISKLRKQRSEITKSLNKNVMCEKRKYRFLKVTNQNPEFKGVLPTIVQSLLDARKETRKEISNLKNKLKEINNEQQKREIETTIDILNQRQLAYKISANSMYGITGVKAGMLPFMPVAMSITYKGREGVKQVSDILQKQYGGELVYGDTDCVLGSTPILINCDGKIFYKTVDEISQGDWKHINLNKEISTPKKGYKVWSDQGFTKIENIVRCKPIESLSQITTHIGTVVCSDNHSLLTDTLKCVTPQEVDIGDNLCVTELPLPKDTPDKPLYPNKLSSAVIQDYKIPQFEFESITSNLAFIWGLFMADGSSGIYNVSKKYKKYSWAINKADTDLLERVRQLCEEEYKRDFQILDTIESGKCYKLVQCKCDNNMVKNYRQLFYTKDKLKKIPNIILQAPFQIRQAFFMGFYAGDGSKKDPSISITFKGQIGSSQLYYLMKSIGYQVSINVRNDKPDIYKLTGSSPIKKMRKVPSAIKKKSAYLSPVDYIYDIQTSNHHFAAGIGQIVVHNSNYVSFQHKKFSITELWDYAIKVADEISKLFPPPMKLEFEEAVYTKFLILTKKRYMYQTALRDGTIKPEIGKKGVLLNRRDNSACIRKTYENVVKIIFENTEDKDKLQSKVITSLLTDVNAMFNHQCLVEDFIITKSTGDYGNLQPQYFLNEKGLHRATLGQYNVPFLTEEIKEEEGIQTPEEETNWYLDKLPAHIQLLEKIKRRGHSRNEGSRLEYVVVETDNLKDKLSAKNETVMYYNKNKGILNLDYLYYLHRLINPIDQILEVIFNLNDFMKNHYNYRVLKKKLTIEMNELFSPIYNIEKDWLYLLKVKEKYSLIYGSKDYCKSRLLSQEVVYKTKYVPTQPIDFYEFLKIKYGLTTSLKTQFIFKDNIILLGNMTESKLIAVIKKECK